MEKIKILFNQRLDWQAKIYLQVLVGSKKPFEITLENIKRVPWNKGN